MNLFTRYNRKIINLLGSVLIALLISGCGGSGGGSETSAGIGGTGVTQGKITGFGSIFVNGIEFETNQSQFEVDGDTTATEANLSIGMVVTITGSVDSNGLTGTADQVEYDDEVQGPIATAPAFVAGSDDTQKILSIFDKTVIIDQTTTSFDNTSFDTIAKDDIVEISGFKSSATQINATFVKKIGVLQLGVSEVELKGTISNLSLSSRTFLLSGINISYDNQTEIEVPGGILSNGLFVEVEGVLQTATSILAEEIEFEDEDFEDGEELSLQGVITGFNNIADFTVGGQEVDASGASLSPANATLANGVNVEVEGEIVNGILVADEVELREGEVKIKARVSSIDLANNRFSYGFPGTISTIQVTVNNQTSFEDEVSSTPNFSLNQLMINDFVKMEGIDTGSEIIASEVKRENVEDTVVQGVMNEYVATVRINILGIIFDIDGTTNVPSIPSVGDIVKITDNNIADGTFDEVEIEN